MEDKKQQIPQFNGWKDIQITPEVPVQGIIEFLNILNQRLVLIEDQLTIKNDDGQVVTLTQYWIDIQKKEYEQMLAEYQKQMAEKAKAQEQQTPTDVQ